MAQQRMFTKKIVDSDAFLEMPLSSQCLYFHLNMRADDDGFIGNPKSIMRTINASEDDLNILILKRFVLVIDDGVIVIKHWRMHNCIRQNKYTETSYIEHKMKLFLTENGSYSTTHGIPVSEVDRARDIVDMEELEGGDEDSPEAAGRSGDKYSKEFERFWSIYPKKDGKGMAYTKYKDRIRDGYTHEDLASAAMNYRKECVKSQKEKKYIKLAKTFLGDSTPFLEYLPKAAAKAAPRGLPESAGHGEVDFKKYL